MPSPGIIRQLTEPNGIGVRIDSNVYEGYEIPVYYDPMIGKLIVWATTRQYAIERMRRVLYEYKITGLKTNLAYLKRIMHVPDFVKGEYNTLFIEKNARMLVRSNGSNGEPGRECFDTVARRPSYQPLARVRIAEGCAENLKEIVYGNTYRRPCGGRYAGQ